MIRRDIQNINRRRGACYWERLDVKTRTWFAVWCATRLVVRDMWKQLDDIWALLDREIGNLVAGKTVYELENKDEFSAFGDDVPLLIPMSPLNVLEH